MKTALSFGIVLLTFLDVTKAATPDPKEPQILIRTKIVEMRATEPSDGGAQSALLNDLQRPPGSQKAPALAAVFTDPQFQVVIRGLNQRKGVDLVSAPEVTTGADQRAETEVLRDFTIKGESGKPLAIRRGIHLEALARMSGADKLDLDLFPYFVEYDGVVDHKNGSEEPVFRGRKTKVGAVMTSGQTAVLEMEPRTDDQIVQEEDGPGHIVSSKTVRHITRTLVFVTAYVVEPVRGEPQGPKDAAATPSPGPASGK